MDRNEHLGKASSSFEFRKRLGFFGIAILKWTPVSFTSHHYLPFYKYFHIISLIGKGKKQHVAVLKGLTLYGSGTQGGVF